ncbi:MAG: class I SAM-dependent DNA methyltransferase [Tepidisphaerales bacterium]
MPLSRNEIRARAIAFARDWSEVSREKAEAQTFWNEFFNVFGISRRKVASFEEPVKNFVGDTEFIDLFWKGMLIAEHKSRGKDLAKAHTQALGYVQNLINEDRGDEVPRYILVSDFARFALHDLEPDKPENETLDFDLRDLPRHIRAFGFIAGYETRRVDPEDPANLQAVELLGNLHDQLEEGGYAGHELERFLVRILFCLFADHTGIFDDPHVFRFYIEQHTAPDGSDLGPQLARIFGVLNTPRENRQKNLDEELAQLPYVNGELFSEHLGFAEFNTAMRTALVACCSFHWDRISPHIFGALFQSVMRPRERRQIGAHYTSERDIMKLIRSLFLDDLLARFEKVKVDKPALRRLHDHIAGLKFLDPACGCGNFLILAYRELRRLEIEIIRALYGDNPEETQLWPECRVDVDQMHGIEIEEWPARIAEVAMWLMDHQMNQEVFKAFGKPLLRLPLKKSAKIVVGNALRLGWDTVLPAQECAFVMGNPPFVGAKYQNDAQRADMDLIAGKVGNSGLLDYVTGWYFKAVEYIKGTRIRVAFVSTNSITQGEQVGVLWNELFRRGVKIQFAHRTFAWESEARGKAHVHVVVVGWGLFDKGITKIIYDYQDDPEHAQSATVRNISPYLVEGPNVAILNRTKPLCAVPEIGIGNKPIDDGNYLFTTEEKDAFVAIEPAAREFFHPWYGSDEFINGWQRWCLWLGECAPETLRAMPECMKRVDAVREFRKKSKSKPTQALAKKPTRFHVENMPDGPFLVVPKVSSERRPYIPIGFMSPPALVSDLVFVIPFASSFHFGILSSTMHMAWVRQVCGRLKSDYRYSNKLVYNNYPWPQDATDKQTARVESAAQAVLDARARFSGSTLADLYDPLSMPADLSKAHAELDRAVDACYRPQPFISERQRVEYLFNLYERLTAPLAAQLGKTRRKERGNRLAQAFDEGLEETSTRLPRWYVNALKSSIGPDGRTSVTDPLDAIDKGLDELLAPDRIPECEVFLKAVADEPDRSPLPVLISILTVTRIAAAELPSRKRVRDVVERRLIAVGKNAVSILAGL